MSLTPSLPSSFQLASDEVHSWCASLDVPPETSARLYATLTPDERTRRASEAPRGARALRVASMIAFIAALLGLGNWACTRQTPTERSARPLRFTPGSGPIEGDRFVFDEVVEAIHAEGIGRDAIIHAGASDVLRFGVTPVYYSMLRIGTMFFENPSPEHRNYTWKTKLLQIKTLPKGWCIDYDCHVTVDVDTRVGLVAHVPN